MRALIAISLAAALAACGSGTAASSDAKRAADKAMEATPPANAATSPERAFQSVERDEEMQLGAQAYQQVLRDATAQGALLPADAPISQQIRAIAARLVERVPQVTAELAARNPQAAPTSHKGLNWEVSVIQSEQANAFCLPGGKIAVYTGLLPLTQSEDAMAVLMGHEIAHVLLRHGSQRLAEQKLTQTGQTAAGMDPVKQQMVMTTLGAGAQNGFILPYGRNHETQADAVGLMLAAAACYDTKTAVPLWERMSQLGGRASPPEFALTHPDQANRIATLKALLPLAEEFKQQYCR